MSTIIDLILISGHAYCQTILKINNKKDYLFRIMGQWNGARLINYLLGSFIRVYKATEKIEEIKFYLAFLTVVILPNPINGDEVQLLYFTDSCLTESCSEKDWKIAPESPELKYHLVRNLDDTALSSLKETIRNERGWANIFVLKPLRDDHGSIYWVLDGDFNSLAPGDMELVMIESGVFSP